MKKVAKIVLWILQVLLALQFAAPGLSKLSGNPGFIRMFREYGYPEGFYLVVGVMEVAGAVGMLIPRVTFYAAGILMVVMAGATYSHLAAGDPVRRAVHTGVLFLLLALVGYVRRPAFLRKKP